MKNYCTTLLISFILVVFTHLQLNAQNITVSFNAPDSAEVHANVYFENTSTGTGIAKTYWDYKSNGIIDDTSFHGSHGFDSLGWFNVSLTIIDSNGNDYFTSKSIKIFDNTAPIIELIPPDTVYLQCNDVYNEPGVIIFDNYYTYIEPVIGGTFVHTDTSGTFTITYQAIDGSGNESEIVTRYIIISCDNTSVFNLDKNTNAKVILYPNPAHEEITFISETPIKHIHVFDNQGRLLLNLNIDNKFIYSFNTDIFEKGVFLFNLTNVQNEVFKGRFIVD